jgi:SecD/SecF fusion protein
MADLERDAAAKKLTVDPDAIVEVPQGVTIVRAEQDIPKASPPNSWYVLKDQTILGGKDIKNPEQNFDNAPGENGQPNVQFDFTGHGASTWETFTKKLSQRGRDQALGVAGGQTNQHFAIVLDNEIISVPQIDWQQYPNGIDASSGSQITGGFTISSAQRLADLLKTGALPIKLQLISSSQVSATLGRQALH